jgi:alpha-1,3-rhamnosyl/mannosyltransferase
MRVGLVTLVTPTRMTGIGHYVSGLLEGLQKLQHPSEDRYVVFASPQIGQRLGVTDPAFDLVSVPIGESPRAIMRPAYFAWQNSWFQLQARRRRLDVVHVPNLVPVAVGARRLVMTIGDMTERHVPGKYSPARQAYRARLSVSMARRAARVITFSEFSRRDIVQHAAIDSAKVAVTPLAVPPAFARAVDETQPDESPYPSDPPFVLHLGKLLAHKNVDRLIAAMARLVRRGLPHRLVLAGPTVGRAPHYAALARSLGIGDRVTITGYVSNQDAVALCAAAAVVAVPSLCEGFGLVAIEAMLVGTPVVAADAGSLPEIAADAAILVDPTSSASIADGLERALCDPALADRLRRRGRERVTGFSWTTCARQTRDVYRCIADGGPGS